MGTESVPKMETESVPKMGTESVPKMGTPSQNASGLAFWPAADGSSALGFDRFGNIYRTQFWGRNLYHFWGPGLEPLGQLWYQIWDQVSYQLLGSEPVRKI